MKRDSYLADDAAFHDSITCSVDTVRQADIVYLNFSQAFDIVADHILIDKLMKYVLDK